MEEPFDYHAEVRKIDSQIQLVATQFRNGEIDKWCYEGRLKCLRDEAARLSYAYERGFKIGKIWAYQELLDEPIQPSSELEELSNDALVLLLSELKERLRFRNG